MNTTDNSYIFAAQGISNIPSPSIPPKGPDGNYYILEKNSNKWVKPSNKMAYSDEYINKVTNNGLDTFNILKNGFDIKLNSSPYILNISKQKANTIGSDSRFFGQQLWKYKVVLYNHKQRLEIPTRAIKTLCIEDDLLTWPLRGYIIIENKMESFERSDNSESFYFLRSDARDEIYIELYPIFENQQFPDHIWKLEADCVVYDVEDLPHTEMTTKQKKLYFWDKRFQHLQEKNMQWSTATGKRFTSFTNNSPCPHPISHATDMQRSMYTGEAIASILYEAGYEEFIDFDNWSWGKSKIFYTFKADQTIWENISYILDQHVSEDDKDDICILNWNRGKRKLNLTPVWKFFKNAGNIEPGELQIEHMFFSEIGSNKIYLSPFKAPLSIDASNSIDIKLDAYNKITNYRFSQTSGMDNSRAFVSRPVYSHCHKNKKFNVDVIENEISNIKENYFKKNYVEYVLSPGKYPVMALNKTKTTTKSVSPQFSPISNMDEKNDRISRSKEGRGKILYAGLFLNQSLFINVIGSTHRLSGTFIGIDRANTNSDTVYDYQLCGQYFVVNIKHILNGSAYTNEITMIKAHAYKSLPVNEGIE